MKRTTYFIVFIFVLLTVITSCKTQGNNPHKISIREFSSDDFPIICSLDSLVRLYGIPDASYIYPNKKLVFDSLGKPIGKYYFSVYRYPNWSMSYIVCNDSAELFYINLRRDNIRIRFRNTFLDGNTTIKQLNELLQVSNNAYYIQKDEEMMLGYSDYGYSLMYFGEEKPLLGSVDFYFDKNKKLIYINFVCPPGSIVYSNQ